MNHQQIIVCSVHAQIGGLRYQGRPAADYMGHTAVRVNPHRQYFPSFTLHSIPVPAFICDIMDVVKRAGTLLAHINIFQTAANILKSPVFQVITVYGQAFLQPGFHSKTAGQSIYVF